VLEARSIWEWRIRLTEKADLENMLAAFILCGVMVVEGC
jgi:hypothetical protein